MFKDNSENLVDFLFNDVDSNHPRISNKTQNALVKLFKVSLQAPKTGNNFKGNEQPFVTINSNLRMKLWCPNAFEENQ